MSKVIIIGGGIVGLMSAYYLSKHKYEITIIDKTDMLSSCSVGNAGLIVPSHFVPIASPGVFSTWTKLLFEPESQFGLTLSPNKDLISWIWKFYRKSNNKNVKLAEKPLLGFNTMSRELYKDLYRDDNFDFELQEKGVIKLCKTEKYANEEINLAEKAIRLGLNVRVLNNEQLSSIEKCKMDVVAGVLYKSNAHLTPNKLIEQLIQYLKRQNVKFRTENEVNGFLCENGKIKFVNFNDRCQEVNEVILAAGAYSRDLAKKLKIKLPIQSGKGYSINIEKPKIKPTYPALLIESRVAVTPMGLNLRIAGGMEIDSINHKINYTKLKFILKNVSKYFVEIKIKIPEEKDVWVGHRPLSPDGMPFIGKSDRYNNLTIATGHTMMGLSLGAATGKIVEELITGQNLSFDISQFNPNRYK